MHQTAQWREPAWITAILVLVLATALFGASQPRKKKVIAEGGLNFDPFQSRRDLLPWLLGLCVIVFALDLNGLFDSATDIGYVLAVMLSLSSRRHWHPTAIATFGATLLLVARLLVPHSEAWW